MKWDLLMILFSIGAVAGYGAWEENRVYNYKVQAYSSNSDGGMAARARMAIYPLSNVLLVGRINLLEYNKVDRQLSGDNLDFSGMDFGYQLPMNKPFQIHLENGVIHSISVDPMMTNEQINQLKVIVSQFQVDTNAQYLLKSEGEHLPEEGSNNAFYKTMEPTFAGNCETLYDISTLSDYLVKSNPKWVALPNLKERGDFIKIDKTKDFNNCNERNRYLAFYKSDQSDFQSNSNSNSDSTYDSDEMSTEQPTNRMYKGSTPFITRIIISGDLQTYTIQSSITTGNAGGFYDYMEVTLESVEERTIQRMLRFEGIERLVNVGNLVCGTDVENRDHPMTNTQNSGRPMANTQNSGRPMANTQNSGRPETGLQNLQSGGSCRKAEVAREKWSSCWTAFPAASTICKSSFTPEWEDAGTECCGFLCLGKKAKCRLSFPGCVTTVCYSVFVSHDSLCKDSYNDEFPVTCGGFVDCSPGFWGARCCPSTYA